MAASELTIEIIHEYLQKYNGVVANREAVKYFKRYLTDPASKDDARAKFKKYINILATTRSEGDEKFLVLKPKYNAKPNPNPIVSSVPQSRIPTNASLSPMNDPRLCIGLPTSPITSSVVPDYTMSSPSQSPNRQPPPYRPPPPVTSPSQSFDSISISSLSSYNDYEAPVVPPRRRSQDKIVMRSPEVDSKSVEPVQEQVQSENEEKQTVSVKERTQKFNRLASVDNELNSSPQHPKEKQQNLSKLRVF